MKNIKSDIFKIVISGTALILIYKCINNFEEIKHSLSWLFSLFFPCILGAVIAFFLYVPAFKLEKLFKKSKLSFIKEKARIFGTLSLYLVIFLFIAFLIMYLFPRLYKNIEELLLNIPKYLSVIDNYTQENRYLASFSITDIINEKISEYLSLAQINKYFGIIKNVANSFISVFVSIVISIYIILDKEKIMRYLRKLRRTFFGGKFMAVTIYFKKIVTLFYSYFAGLAFDSILVGFITIVGLSIMSIPYAILLGFVSALGNMIPFFGPIISVSLVSVITLVSGGIRNLISVLIFLAVIYIIDAYFLQPKVVGNSTGIRPLLVLVSVIIFGELFGFVGMIIGVPLTATLKLFMDDYLDDGKIDGLKNI